MTVIEKFPITIPSGYDTHEFKIKDTPHTLQIKLGLKFGFLIASRYIKKYMKLFEKHKYYYELHYWPSGKKPNYSDKTDRYLFVFDVLQLPTEVIVEDIYIDDTFLYGGIGGVKSRINNGCDCLHSGEKHYYTEGFVFIDKTAKKMLDNILNSGGV